MEVGPDELRQAVERLHRCQARLREIVQVTEQFRGQPVWEGIVHVFDVTGLATATRCYAWSSPIEGSDRRRFYAVLQTPPVNTPEEAVRASIVSDQRAGKSSA